MFTVCVPIYNYDSRRLIIDLNKQADMLDFPLEIVVINDGSHPDFNKLYDSPFPVRVRYILLPKNIGRAKVRNLFLKYARFDYLLFLDCDDKIISDTYLKEYSLQISSGCGVVCGGIKYQKDTPDQNKILHWNYETKKEKKHIKRRKRSPYEAFISNNFLIRKEIFSTTKFNESLEQYGHEDTLFGYDLYKAGVNIKFIKNPVLNEDLNENIAFLKKAEMASQNLVAILKFTPDKGFVESITLLKVYFRLRRMGIIFLLKPFEKIITTLCYKRLLSGSTSLTCLNLYKFCLFVKYYRSRK